MSAVIDDHGHAGDHAHGPAKGLMRWVLTTGIMAFLIMCR